MAEDDGIAGRAFVVTGGTQGVGAAIARALAARGAGGVAICGRNHANGAAVVREIEAAGSRGLYVPADLASEADCRAVVRTARERFGPLQGLVNAGASTERGSLESTTVEQWDRTFAINARAPFVLIQETVAAMKRDKVEGSIVNFLTLSGYGGQPYITAYCASKGALAILTKNVAHAVRFDRIRVNGIVLGWTDTPQERAARVAEGKPPGWMDEQAALQPFGRLVRPEEAARLALFLLGTESGLMTGALVDFAQRIMGAWD